MVSFYTKLLHLALGSKCQQAGAVGGGTEGSGVGWMYLEDQMGAFGCVSARGFGEKWLWGPGAESSAQFRRLGMVAALQGFGKGWSSRGGFWHVTRDHGTFKGLLGLGPWGAPRTSFSPPGMGFLTLCLGPAAAVTQHRRLDGSQRQKYSLLQFCKPEVQHQGVWRAVSPSGV